MSATQPPPPFVSPSGRLRVIATSDLHLHLFSYDYFSDTPKAELGLERLVGAIAELRADPSVTTLLCDNGDLLQGTPMADVLTDFADQTHPMIAALNSLNYDAMTLGNHDLDYGLTALRKALAAAAFPVVSANLAATDGQPLAQRFVILDRTIRMNDGQDHPIKIGITGFAPPQVALWDRGKHGGVIAADDIVETAQGVIPDIKAAGADIVIVLCHSGLGEESWTPKMENAAIPLAAVDGIDALICGHTHKVFPMPAGESSAAVDHQNGQINGTPAVMPGHFGRSLGVIDLYLRRAAGRWQVADSDVYLEGGGVRAAEVLPAAAARMHAATINAMANPLTQTHHRLHSYFAFVQPDPTQAILAQAAINGLADAIAGTAYEGLPLLAATAPFRFGSGGPFVDIKPGTVEMRHAIAICPFTDTLCGVLQSGASMRLWLERAASHFCQLVPDASDQPLINPESAGYNFDTLHGLTYTFDLTQPARFDDLGNVVNPGATRVHNIRHHGRPVTDTDQFVVATNSYRAFGGGGFAGLDGASVVAETHRQVRAHLFDYLIDEETLDLPNDEVWSLQPVPGCAGLFSSARAAADLCPPQITALGPKPKGKTRFRLQL